jgi:hypothetical protein
MPDFVFVHGPNAMCPLHAELVGRSRSKKAAAAKIVKAMDESEAGDKLPECEASVDDGKLYVDVVLPRGVKVHVIIAPRPFTDEADQVLEYD